METGRLAIDGGRPLRAEPYPAWPRWDEREEAVLLDVLLGSQSDVEDVVRAALKVQRAWI